LLAPVEFGPRPPYLVVVVGDGRLPVAVFRVAVLLLERDGLERLLVYGDEPAHAAHLPTRVERPREDGDVPLERCPVVGEHVGVRVTSVFLELLGTDQAHVGRTVRSGGNALLGRRRPRRRVVVELRLLVGAVEDGGAFAHGRDGCGFGVIHGGVRDAAGVPEHVPGQSPRTCRWRTA